MWNFNGELFVVSGGSVFHVNRAGGSKALTLNAFVPNKLGSIPGTGPVSMSDNGTQLIIVNGVSGYIVPTTFGGLGTEIENPNFFSASTVLYFDGYFVLDRKGTNEFFLSALNDGTMYSGLDFASAVAQPGLIIATKQNLQLLFLFTQNHIEMWYDAGTADFPFQRYSGGVIERGLLAPYALVQQDDALFFLGVDRVFYRLQGNTAVRISTHALETAWSKYPKISDAFCFTFTTQGHKMVVLTFPSAPHTWVFDISTQMWHERESWDANGNSIGRWRGNAAIEIYDKVLIGDAFSGQIFELDWNAATEDGNVMQMLAHSATISQGKMRVFVNRLELDMQVGVGRTTGQGSDPQVMLRWSRDGGVSWSRQQKWRSMGKIGATLQRLRWLSLGNAYQWVFELTISDPVQRTLIATHLDTEIGM